MMGIYQSGQVGKKSVHFKLKKNFTQELDGKKLKKIISQNVKATDYVLIWYSYWQKKLEHDSRESLLGTLARCSIDMVVRIVDRCQIKARTYVYGRVDQRVLDSIFCSFTGANPRGFIRADAASETPYNTARHAHYAHIAHIAHALWG